MDDVPVGDRKRFAYCFKHLENKQNIDWSAAATAYDPKVKEASFKTVCLRNLKNVGDGEIPETDLNRFAFCYVFAAEKGDIDWAAVISDLEYKGKPESFKTVTLRALKKHGYPSSARASASSPAKKEGVKKSAPKKTAGKRKSQDVDDEDDGAKKPRKTLKTLAIKQTANDEQEDYDDDYSRQQLIDDQLDREADDRLEREAEALYDGGYTF